MHPPLYVDKLYTAVPSASEPNHLFIQSATSCGVDGNENYERCGAAVKPPVVTPKDFPQMTLYDSLYVNNVARVDPNVDPENQITPSCGGAALAASIQLLKLRGGIF